MSDALDDLKPCPVCNRAIMTSVEGLYCPDCDYTCDNYIDELNMTLGGGDYVLFEVDSYSNVNGSYPKCPHCGKDTVKR